LRFAGAPNFINMLETLGEVPLPPYIARPEPNHMESDHERYQTVFAQPAGSVAAPTAGLHFTLPLLDKIRSRGVHVCCLTLHVGFGTFAPVKTEALESHVMHEERYELGEETAVIINQAKREGRRVIAVGTTTARVLESVATQPQRGENADTVPSALPLLGERAEVRARVSAGAGKTRIFIYPPYDFKIVDVLLTNFHVPRSTLLMLVSAFAAPSETRGRDLILSAYTEAIRERYRFFSYGDAMLVL